MKLAVVGKDVSESLSPKMHNFILGCMGQEVRYDAVSVPPEKFGAEIEELFSSYDGLNITIPFKQAVLKHLVFLKQDAQKFGAVNTVVTRTRMGYNTDGYGFLALLAGCGIDFRTNFLVLGAGGAGRCCIKSLCEAGANVSAYERNDQRLNAVYGEFGGFTPYLSVPVKPFGVIINATGVGMHDTTGQTPFVQGETGDDVLFELIKRCGVAVDLIYRPEESEFLRVAREAGKRTVNGEAMLFYQAYAADCIFLGRAMNYETAGMLWKRYKEEQ